MGQCLRLNAMKSLEHKFWLKFSIFLFFLDKIPVRILKFRTEGKELFITHDYYETQQ